jgi:Zn-dependent membrane protease YugP
MTVNLSDDVYYSRSITAVSVAAHECGHAVQHATGYAPVRLRSQLVPLVNFSSSVATWVIVLGIALMSVTGSALLCWVGIALIAMSALFAIVTLPVEYNASYRALAWLQTNGMTQSRDINSAREALMWAARTYLVAALSAIATLLYYVALVTRRR